VKVLVDECVPLKLVRLLAGHDFSTVQQKGWDGFSNGKLLALAEPAFDLFLTSDRNLQYQQNLKGRKIAVLLLSTNHWPTLKKKVPLVQSALDKIQPGEFLRLEIPKN
jgi:predicted nuclease of predicted toxin-antitoxin system